MDSEASKDVGIPVARALILDDSILLPFFHDAPAAAKAAAKQRMEEKLVEERQTDRRGADVIRGSIFINFHHFHNQKLQNRPPPRSKLLSNLF